MGAFSEYPPLGRFAVRDMRQTVASASSSLPPPRKLLVPPPRPDRRPRRRSEIRSGGNLCYCTWLIPSVLQPNPVRQPNPNPVAILISAFFFSPREKICLFPP